MLAKAVVGPEGVHAVYGVPLSLVFVQGLQHVLNPPQLPLDVDVLLAGRLRLVWWWGERRALKGRLNTIRNLQSAPNTLRETGE